jgi:peptidoglycan hydrolase CwlO-like protein
MDRIMKSVEILHGKIEESKKKEANLQGRMEETEKRLKETYGFTLEQAKEWITKEEESLSIREKEIRRKFEILQESYPW